MENSKDKKLVITPLNESKKVSQVLANDTCRAILDAVSDEPMSATQISEKLALPLTTIDYNLKKLSEVGLITIHHKRWSPKGKKVNFYAPAEKFIVITPKLSQIKVMQTLRTLVLPIVAILIIVVGFFAYYNYPKFFGAGTLEMLGLRTSEKVSEAAPAENKKLTPTPSATGTEGTGGAGATAENLTANERACANSGGNVSTSMCCKSASDFPNTCLIGACGCAPDYSHEIKVCDCGPDKCFNGTACVPFQ